MYVGKAPFATRRLTNARASTLKPISSSVTSIDAICRGSKPMTSPGVSSLMNIGSFVR